MASSTITHTFLAARLAAQTTSVGIPALAAALLDDPKKDEAVRKALGDARDNFLCPNYLDALREVVSEQQLLEGVVADVDELETADWRELAQTVVLAYGYDRRAA